MLGEILLNVIVQLVYFVGAVFLIGWLMAKLNQAFYRLTGGGMAVCVATGALGTPIHELSHAAMCLAFGHKIHDIKLFQVGDEDGVLGYVSHSYNKKNIWAVIGNYFIGVAPIIGGSGVIFLLISWLLPNAYTEISSLLSGFSSSGFSFEGILDVCLGMIVAMCIALHVTLSGADIKGALPALPWLAGALLVINLFLGLIIPSAYVGFCAGMNSFGAYLLGLMCLSVVLSLSCFVILFLVRLVIGFFTR